MINRLFINYPDFVKQNPVKINSADPVDTIMLMGRFEMEKLFMSVVRKYDYAIASRNGEPKYKADRRIRDVEKHLNNHFKNERDLMDTLVYFVEEGAIVPTKKSMASNKSNGDGITMSKKFTIKASRSAIRRRAIKASDSATGYPYLYVLKHGYGPGTLPRGVKVGRVEDYKGYTLVWLDRFLTTSELRDYDIPSETQLDRYLGNDVNRFMKMGGPVKSSRTIKRVSASKRMRRPVKASAYDEDIVMYFNGKIIYEGPAGGYMYDAVYDICKDDSTRLKIQEWCNQFGDHLFDDEFGDADETTYTFCSLVYDLFADGDDYIDGDGILNFEIFPESDEAEIFNEYGDVESSTRISAARDTTVDKDAVRELVLYITNKSDLYPQVQSIVKNMQRKIKQGKYDDELAVKAWQYLADAGVEKYDKEFGSGNGTKSMLNKATREQIARELRDYFADEVNDGVEASQSVTCSQNISGSNLITL